HRRRCEDRYKRQLRIRLSGAGFLLRSRPGNAGDWRDFTRPISSKVAFYRHIPTKYVIKG
ncbi:MAG: hypothetical protein ACWGQW_25515, partial [bacterium]